MPAMQIQISIPQIMQAVAGMRGLSAQAQAFAAAQRQISRLAPGNPFARAAALSGQPVTPQMMQMGLQLQVVRAQAAAARAQQQLAGPNRFAAIQQAILSSRFNIGGRGVGVSPLVGRSMAALGIGGGAGAAVAAALVGLTAVFAAATVGVRAFLGAVKAGAEALSGTAQQRLMSGGTMRNVGFLQALGIRDIAGPAAALRGLLSSDPGAMGAGARLGLGITPPRGMGRVNEAALLQTAIERVAALSTEGERLAAAQKLQLDQYLPLIEIYRRHTGLVQADRRAREVVADPKTLRAAEDFQFALGRVRENFGLIIQAIAKPFLKDAAAGLNVFATGLRQVAEFLSRNPRFLTALIEPLQRFFGLIIDFAVGVGILNKQTVIDVMEAFRKERERLDKGQAGATDKFGQAVDRFGQYVAAGTYGGGPRARGALPSAWNGYAWQYAQAQAGTAFRWGAWSGY